MNEQIEKRIHQLKQILLHSVDETLITDEILSNIEQEIAILNNIKNGKNNIT